MSCVLSEILPSSDSTIEVLTNLTEDVDTAFLLRNSDVAVLSLPSSFDASVKPFRLVINGKFNVTNASESGILRLCLGSSDNLDEDVTIGLIVGIGTTPALESRFRYTAECFWNPISNKLILNENAFIGEIDSSGVSTVSSVTSQDQIKFVLFGKFTSAHFTSSDSITITEFKLEAV